MTKLDPPAAPKKPGQETPEESQAEKQALTVDSKQEAPYENTANENTVGLEDMPKVKPTSEIPPNETKTPVSTSTTTAKSLKSSP